MKRAGATIIREVDNQGSNNPGDMLAALEYRGVKIGISSMGDREPIKQKYLTSSQKITVVSSFVPAAREDA